MTCLRTNRDFCHELAVLNLRWTGVVTYKSKLSCDVRDDSSNTIRQGVYRGGRQQSTHIVLRDRKYCDNVTVYLHGLHQKFMMDSMFIGVHITLENVSIIESKKGKMPRYVKAGPKVRFGVVGIESFENITILVSRGTERPSPRLYFEVMCI